MLKVLLLWLVPDSCQISMSAQVVFTWLHLPLTSGQPAVIHYTDELMSLAMDLAALCDMWR